MSHSVIVGMGEVGSALKELLSPVYPVYCKDLEEIDIPARPFLMHVCLNYVALGRASWLELVEGYIKRYSPLLIDICSTVPPGTTKIFGRNAVHSTTRGLHPNLVEGLKTIVKHIGGPMANEVADYYRKSGIRCLTHRRPDTTEVAHLSHLIDYGIQIISADMRNKLCRKANVDYIEAVLKYTDTHNAGFRDMDMPSKIRMSLLPPNGKIGGHCVIQAAKIAIEYGFNSPLVDILAKYNMD